MEFSKIFAWKEGKFWRGQQLLTISQIRGLLATLRWRYECFATIQNYDENGNCISAPLYFDFDGPDAQVLPEARHFVSTMEFLLNVTPKIYFSGRKGFHFIVEHMIEHPQCHLLIQDFAKEVAIAFKSLDQSVYRTNSMFRIPGSIGSDGSAYKIELRREELLNCDMAQIRTLARKQRFIDSGHTPEDIDQEAVAAWLKLAIRKLPRYDTAESLLAHSNNNEMDFTPCLQHMLYHGVDQGRRNEGAFILAKFLKSAGIDFDTALDTTLKQEFWAQYERDGGREVTKVFKSVYRSSRDPQIGCRGASNNAELMRAYCSNMCWLREDMPKLTLIDDRKTP